MAVAAGRAVLQDGTGDTVGSVVFVTREPALLEGGNAAALLGGLGLPIDTEVGEQLGGAPAALDAIAAAPPGALVLGADVAEAAGAGAFLVGDRDVAFRREGRIHRSLPTRTRTTDGVVHDDEDPRLVRDRGTRASIDAAGWPDKPRALAGLAPRDAVAFCTNDPPLLPTTGASSPIFALAALADRRDAGLVAAVEQATVSAATFDPSGVVVRRNEQAARDLPTSTTAAGPEIKVAVPAYDRAFTAKTRWEAGRCPDCGTLALPPRHRCLGCGHEGATELVPLPRTATVYTTTTIHVPVPGLASPYTLALVEVDDVGIRALVTVTDALPGTVEIGDRGSMVFRRVAVRAGVPDYGYAFSPEGAGP